MSDEIAELAYYYPEPYWTTDHVDSLKNLLLFSTGLRYCCHVICMDEKSSRIQSWLHQWWSRACSRFLNQRPSLTRA